MFRKYKFLDNLKYLKWYKVLIDALYLTVLFVFVNAGDIPEVQQALESKTCYLFSWSMTYYDFYKLCVFIGIIACLTYAIIQIELLILKWTYKDMEHKK